jgi:hypothetical protein
MTKRKLSMSPISTALLALGALLVMPGMSLAGSASVCNEGEEAAWEFYFDVGNDLGEVFSELPGLASSETCRNTCGRIKKGCRKDLGFGADTLQNERKTINNSAKFLCEDVVVVGEGCQTVRKEINSDLKTVIKAFKEDGQEFCKGDLLVTACELECVTIEPDLNLFGLCCSDFLFGNELECEPVGALQ